MIVNYERTLSRIYFLFRYLPAREQSAIRVRSGRGWFSNFKINADKSRRACRPELKSSIEIGAKPIRVDVEGNEKGKQ